MIFLSHLTPASSNPAPATTPAAMDRVFKALASETRREILDALREGPRTTGDLVMLFPGVSRFSVMQHLRVLGRARLVVRKKRGRERHNFLNAVPIQQVYERWVSRYEGLWAGALTDLKRRVEGDAARRGGVHPAPSGGFSLRPSGGRAIGATGDRALGESS